MPLNGYEQTIQLPRDDFLTDLPPPTFSHNIVVPQHKLGEQHRQPLKPFQSTAAVQTPARPLFRQQNDAAGLDQFDGPRTAVKQQTVSQQMPHETRKTTATGSGASRSGPSNVPPFNNQTREAFKVEVPNTMPANRGAPAIQHQKSQMSNSGHFGEASTLGNGGRNQNRPLQQRVRIDQEVHTRKASADSRSPDSTTFDVKLVNDFGDGRYIHPENDERTAVFRPEKNVSIDNAVDKPKFPLQQPSARSMPKNPTAHPLPTAQRYLTHGAEIDDGIQDDESTREFFNGRDQERWLRADAYDATPSKTPLPSLLDKRDATATPRQHHGQSAKHVLEDRASSPLSDSDEDEFVEQADMRAKDNTRAAQHYNREHEARYQQKQLRRQERAQQKADAAAKIAESVDFSVSEDELPPAAAQAPPHSNKRDFEQMDYDEGRLGQMNFDQLDKVPFLEDPRHPPSKPAVDEHGVAITLEQKLDKLSQMKPEDQKSFFRSLTDTENEQAGQWFVTTFGTNLKDLMQKRLERRKKALEFELEVKKRQVSVETKAIDIEQELKELKTGGGNLLQGRASPRTAGK